MNAIKQYQAVNTQSSVMDVDNHRLIQLLYDGALERINMAKAQIGAKNFEGKNRLITRAIDILAGLRSFLDMEKGQEISKNLFDLYTYCESRLHEANMKNDQEILTEVAGHIKTVQGAWVGIRQEALEKGLV
jgi:flagellar protein FliS